MSRRIPFHEVALKHPFWQRVIFVALSVLGAGLSYLLYPVLAQVLSPAQFGDVSIVVALSGQITGLLLAFNVVSIYVVHTQTAEEATRITAAIQKLLIQVLMITTAVALVLSPWLLHVLKIQSPWTLLGLGLLVLLSVPAVVWTGFLQGHSELTRIGIYNTGAALAKLICASVFCLLGWGAPGAILGIIFGQLLGLWVLRLVPGTELPPARGSLKRLGKDEWERMKPLAGYVTQSLVVVGMFSFIFSVDILLAKALFSAHTAGVYAGVASLGRTVFFGASILIWIMLAGVNPRDLITSRIILKRYMGLIAVAGGLAVGLFAGLADPIVRISLGTQYLPAATQLWWVGLNQTIAVLFYTYTLYLLVMRRGRPAVLAILVGLSALGATTWKPANTTQLIMSLVAGQIIGFGLYGILIAKDYLTKR